MSKNKTFTMRYINGQGSEMITGQIYEVKELTGGTGKYYSVLINTIQVVDVLPHCSKIEPSSVEDAKRWLDFWIEDND